MMSTARYQYTLLQVSGSLDVKNIEDVNLVGDNLAHLAR